MQLLCIQHVAKLLRKGRHNCLITNTLLLTLATNEFWYKQWQQL